MSGEECLVQGSCRVQVTKGFDCARSQVTPFAWLSVHLLDASTIDWQPCTMYADLCPLVTLQDKVNMLQLENNGLRAAAAAAAPPDPHLQAEVQSLRVRDEEYGVQFAAARTLVEDMKAEIQGKDKVCAHRLVRLHVHS